MPPRCLFKALHWPSLWLALWLPGIIPALAQPAPELFRFGQAGQHRAAVPVRTERNMLVVSAMLNGNGPYNFLLDTGIATALLTSPELAEQLHLVHGELFRVVGAGGEATGLLAYQTDHVRVTLAGGVEARDMRWLVLSADALNLSGFVGLPIHGLLGSELFRSFVVAVQSDANRLVLYAPSAYHPPHGRRWQSLPLTLEQDKAYLTLPVALTDSAARPLRLVLDTGAGHALSLETAADPAHLAVPARHVAAELGQGLSGIVHGQLGRVAALHLGRYCLQAVLTSFPDTYDVHGRATVPRDGNLGYELLKRFALVIDYPHRCLLLRPNVHFGEPFEHDMSGLQVIAGGPGFQHFVVLAVRPGSPAAAAGVQAGDELLNINFAPTNALTLSQINQLLHVADGRVLLLVLRRADGELLTTTLQLRRQI